METIAVNIPDQFLDSQHDALEALTKFHNSSRQTGENASILHLLTHGITSQASVIEELCQKIGQLKADGDIGADLIKKWNESLSVCRKIQKSAYTQFQEEKGKIIGENDLKLIFDVPADIADGKDAVPENCLKNLKQFSGENIENLDIATEEFIRNAFEIGLSQQLSHEGIKSLIIRRLHGFSLLILETYAGNLEVSPSDLTLKQVIWCLEKHFRQESSPLKSLQKLQALPQIHHKQYFKTCGIVARLAKLSVKNITDPDNAKLLEKARATEYFVKSLNTVDKKLIDKENSQRLVDNKEPLGSIAIADFLTKHHASNYDNLDPPQSTVLQVTKEDEGAPEEETVFFVGNNQRGYRRNNFSRGQGAGPNFSNQNRSFPPPRFPNQSYNSNKPQFSRSQPRNGGPQRGNFRGNPRIPSNPPQTNGRYGFNTRPQRGGEPPQRTPYQKGYNRFPTQGIRQQGNRYIQGPPRQPPFPITNTRGHYNSRAFVTPAQAGVGPSDCLLCGGNHSFNSPQCIYFGVKPVPRKCPKHNPPRFAHPPHLCQGDIIAKKVAMDDSEHSFILD